MRRGFRAAAWVVGWASAGAAVFGGCGGSDGGPDVRIDGIRPAIAAVEAQLGGPQVYSEVNATPSEVNVFVVRNGEDLAYVVRGDAVDAPPSGQPYDGPTFPASAVAFEDGVLDVVADQLPDSEIAAFSVTPNARGGVDYIATVRGESAELRVLLAADGAVLQTG